MENLFKNVKPAEIYDLKGSTVGRFFFSFNTRQATENEKKKNQFKDIDLMDKQKTIQVGKTAAIEIIKQLTSDVKFLESHQIMDYSLLLGIVKFDKNDEKTYSL